MREKYYQLVDEEIKNGKYKLEICSGVETEEEFFKDEILMISRNHNRYRQNLINNVLAYMYSKIELHKEEFETELLFYIENLLKLSLNIFSKERIVNTTDSNFIENFELTMKDIEEITSQAEKITKGENISLNDKINLENSFYTLSNLVFCFEEQQIHINISEEQEKLINDKNLKAAILFKKNSILGEKNYNSFVKNVYAGLSDILGGINYSKTVKSYLGVVSEENIIVELVHVILKTLQTLCYISNSTSYIKNELQFFDEITFKDDVKYIYYMLLRMKDYLPQCKINMENR